MKNYQEVVNTRYNKETDEELKQSIYSKSHPIGKYSRETIFKGLKDFIAWFSKAYGLPASKKVLDIGCGSGEILSFFSENGFSAQKMTGIDLSEVRINRAKKEFPQITFATGDLLNLDLDERSFDLITSFDIISHFSTRDEILKALANTRDHLDDDGLFLWYDIYSKDHFITQKNSESSGFSKIQMEEFGKESGFEVIYSRSFFKLFFNRYHSIYQATRVPSTVLRTLETILPGSPGNIMMVMKKKSS